MIEYNFTELCKQWRSSDLLVSCAFIGDTFIYENYHGATKYFSANKKLWTIKSFPDGLWRDRWGCVYALSEASESVDDISRCGINAVSLPVNHPANDACNAHDFAYSSPAYQLYNTRADADRMLEQHLKIVGYPVMGKVFRFISKLFGGRFWENKETR